MQCKAAEHLERHANKDNPSRLTQNPVTATDNAMKDLCEVFDNLTIDNGKVDDSETECIDDILAAIADIPQIDLKNYDLDKPNTWNKVKSSSYSKQWENGYKEELQSLKDMGVYKLIPCSQILLSTKIQKGHPVFRLKYDTDGKPVRWKVQLVFKGFEQIYGKDYTSC